MTATGEGAQRPERSPRRSRGRSRQGGWVCAPGACAGRWPPGCHRVTSLCAEPGPGRVGRGLVGVPPRSPPPAHIAVTHSDPAEPARQRQVPGSCPHRPPVSPSGGGCSWGARPGSYLGGRLQLLVPVVDEVHDGVHRPHRVEVVCQGRPHGPLGAAQPGGGERGAVVCPAPPPPRTVRTPAGPSLTRSGRHRPLRVLPPPCRPSPHTLRFPGTGQAWQTPPSDPD